MINRETALKFCVGMAVILAFLYISDIAAFASDGADLPWNTGLEKLTDAFSGKTALYIVCIGVFVVAGMIMFGGDLGYFGKGIMIVIIAGSIIGAIRTVAEYFIVTGALLL